MKNLEDVQWLVLTSPQGVQALSGVLDVNAMGAGVKGGLRWAAVGTSTAQAMRKAGWPVDFIPSEATGAALGRELPFEAEGSILHVTSDQSKNDLLDALQARGGRYERVALYRTTPRQPTTEELEQLLASHVVTLASSSAAQQFAYLGGQAVRVVVMGRQTAQTAEHLGFQHITVAPEPSLDGLEQAVWTVLTQATI